MSLLLFFRNHIYDVVAALFGNVINPIAVSVCPRYQAVSVGLDYEIASLDVRYVAEHVET